MSKTIAKTVVPEGLRLISSTLDDTEALRIMTENRYRSATNVWVDEKTGEQRGLGLDPSDKLVKTVATTLEALKIQEHQLVLQLARELRKTCFSAWQKSDDAKGVGEKTLARLLASIGDPYMRLVVEFDDSGEPVSIASQPRALGQLFAYAGYGVGENGAALRRVRGMTQDDAMRLGKPETKKRAYLVAEGLVKAGVRTVDKTVDESLIDGYPLENREATSRYGEAYLARRAETRGRLHSVECVRCGPSGKPAQPGSPWSGAHQQADALRILAKLVLEDLWRIAREHHTGMPIGEPAYDEDDKATQRLAA